MYNVGIEDDWRGEAPTCGNSNLTAMLHIGHVTQGLRSLSARRVAANIGAPSPSNESFTMLGYKERTGNDSCSLRIFGE
jgi:hypothetical protein